MKNVNRRLRTLEQLACQRGITVGDILRSQEWVAIRTAVLQALESYDDAREAVARALLEVGDDA